MIIGDRETFVGIKVSSVIAESIPVSIENFPETLSLYHGVFPGFIPTPRAP